MNDMFLHELISYPESDWLDFKLEWHANTANLILDILCLANSDADSDRYIVFGVNDKDHSKLTTPENNRKTLEELNGILSKANFNRIPMVNLQTITINNSEIDILTIKKTRYRPYFLTKDYMRDKTTVRAGVVYTRNGAVNTSKDGTANENQIADMWRERFGLNMNPLDRLKIYIQDTDNWQQINNPLLEDWVSYYYAPFPEFTVEFKKKNFADYAFDSFGNLMHANTFWGHTIGSSAESIYVVKYLNTILADGGYTVMDNHRHYLINPHSRYVWYSSKKPITEVHVETEEDFVTDTGLYMNHGLERINDNNKYCNRANVGYHVEGGLNNGLQKILDKDVYNKCTFISDEEQITHNIYLIPKGVNITEFVRAETLRILKLETDPNSPKDND